MSQYDIRVKIDPSGVVTGRQKVEQELRGLDNSAGRTTDSMERMTAAEFRAAGGAEGLAKSTRAAATSQRDMEKALDRVLSAVDGEAAAIRRLNGLLDDAKRLHDAGKISAEQYARVQNLVAQGSQGVTRSLGQQRAGYTQLGFQVQDITQQMALGVNPMVVLAQQAGQTASAINLAVGEQGALGKAATFLSGPWGSILIAATAILGTFAYKYLTSGEDIETATEKLKEDAKQTKLTEEAKAAYGRTLDGVIESIRAQRKALDEATEAAKGSARQDAIDAQANVLRIQRIKTETEAQLALAEAIYEAQRARATGPTQQAEMASLGLTAAYDRIERVRKSLGDVNVAIGTAQRNAEQALGAAIRERVDALADPVSRLRDRYKTLAEETTRASTAAEKENGVLAKKLFLLKQQEEAEIKAAQAAERRTRASNDGVARFRSREQAIGIAGRELQGIGLRVDGNSQFGYTTGHSNDADHNKYGLDVNVGRGVVEANVPDLKAKFDRLALQYQKRGYNVIWNGQKYLAFGNGPSGPAKGHQDHIHLYAPKTIVGKETMASTAAQENREAAREETVAEQKRDFVAGIENKAAVAGAPDNRAAALQSKIEAALLEYERRFNEAPSPEERQRIVGGLTDADAREQAENFRKAYQYPLEDMQLALGKTGIERQIYNKILEETAKKGAPLDDIEKSMIENSIRMTDSYARQQEILEQIAAPLENYKATVTALNALLAQGAISQSEFNARISEMGAATASTFANVPGVDPFTGQSYEQVAAEAEEQARYDRELATFESHKQRILAMGISYDALLEAAHRRHVQNLNNIDLSRRQVALQAASSISESLLSIAENAAGKQSGIYKAMFAVSKAFAIAEAVVNIQAALAKALNAPFPQNLVQFGIVAAQAASIVSNIAAVSANFADGGLVRGPGGPRDDAIPANLSAGEYVVNANAVARPGNKALLEAINSGTSTAALRRSTPDRSAGGVTAGGDTISLSFGDVVVQTGSGVTGEDGETIGRDVKRALSELVDERLRIAQRPGGQLTRTRPSVMGN